MGNLEESEEAYKSFDALRVNLVHLEAQKEILLAIHQSSNLQAT